MSRMRRAGPEPPGGLMEEEDEEDGEGVAENDNGELE